METDSTRHTPPLEQPTEDGMPKGLGDDDRHRQNRPSNCSLKLDTDWPHLAYRFCHRFDFAGCGKSGGEWRYAGYDVSF